MPRRTTSDEPPRRRVARNPEGGGGGAARGRRCIAGDKPSIGGHSPLFPLRLRAPWAEAERPRRRYLSRRLGARARVDTLLGAGVRALNALAASRADGRVVPTEPAFATADLPLSAAQHGALNNIGRAIKACLPAPIELEEYPDGALCELLRSRGVYDVQESLATAAYDPAKLKVLRGGTTPLPAHALVGVEAAAMLARADIFIVRPQHELDELGPPIAPHWDATLRFSRRARAEFIDRLDKVGLVTWRTTCRQQIGVFFVRKKNGEIRMVLDCRPSNACHRQPPHSSLATAGSLSTINLANSWLDDEAAPGAQADPHAGSVDLADGYYQFKVPEVSSWFGLGLQRTARQAGVSAVFCEERRCEVPVHPDDMLWACFAGLPMGWSWGLYFCHAALSECCLRAMRTTQPTPHMLADRAPAPRLTKSSGFCAPYVDNGNVVAGSKEATQILLEEGKREMALAIEIEPLQQERRQRQRSPLSANGKLIIEQNSDSQENRANRKAHYRAE